MQDLKIQHKAHKVWAPNVGKFIDETYTHATYDGMSASINGVYNKQEFKKILLNLRT